MKSTVLSTAVLVLAGFFVSTAVHAVIITDFQSSFRTAGDDLDFTIDVSGWNSGPAVSPFFSFSGATFEEYGSFGGGLGTGLGEIVVDIANTGPGTAMGSFHAFLDLDIDEKAFFNEFATVENDGALGNGQDPDSFEVDEPGFVFGDIDLNFEAGALDGTNGVTSTLFPDGDDVSLAMGWDLSIDALEIGKLTLLVSDAGLTVPGSLFSIIHTDPVSMFDITYSGLLETAIIPEPASVLLLCTGILGVLARKRRSGKRTSFQP